MKEKDRGVRWFNTTFYPQNKTARAVLLEEKILPRMRQEEITLFTPWGPRYRWETRGPIISRVDKEVEALRFLAGVFSRWQECMPEKRFHWLFLGADLYGTRVNNLPENAVRDYFSSLADWLAEILPVAVFRFWSEFNGGAEFYRQHVRNNFDYFVSPRLLTTTAQTAKAMGRNSDPKEYLVERLAEAMLVEECFKPIKISGVARYKDDEVDWELPRLYFLPESLQAPWL